ELDRGGEEAVAPDPEDGPRSPGHDRSGHPGDVAGADGGGERGHERLERRERARGPRLRGGKHRPHGVAEVDDLDEAETDREEEPGSEEERDRPGPPDRVADPEDRGPDGLREHELVMIDRNPARDAAGAERSRRESYDGGHEPPQ